MEAVDWEIYACYQQQESARPLQNRITETETSSGVGCWIRILLQNLVVSANILLSCSLTVGRRYILIRYIQLKFVIKV